MGSWWLSYPFTPRSALQSPKLMRGQWLPQPPANLHIKEAANLQSKHTRELRVTVTQSIPVPFSQRPFLPPCLLLPVSSGLQAALSENTIWTLEMNEQHALPLYCNHTQNTIRSSLCSPVSVEGPMFCLLFSSCLSFCSEWPIRSFVCVTQPVDSEEVPGVMNVSRHSAWIHSHTVNLPVPRAQMSSWKA